MIRVQIRTRYRLRRLLGLSAALLKVCEAEFARSSMFFLVDMGIEVRFHMNESLWQIIIRFLQHWELCEKSRHRAEVAQVKIRDDKCQNKRL